MEWSKGARLERTRDQAIRTGWAEGRTLALTQQAAGATAGSEGFEQRNDMTRSWVKKGHMEMRES